MLSFSAATNPSTPQPPVPSSSMTTREKVEKLLDRLSETELEAEYERLRGAVEGDDEMAPLPNGWGETLTGEPMPNLVAAVRRSREAH